MPRKGRRCRGGSQEPPSVYLDATGPQMAARPVTGELADRPTCACSGLQSLRHPIGSGTLDRMQRASAAGLGPQGIAALFPSNSRAAFQLCPCSTKRRSSSWVAPRRRSKPGQSGRCCCPLGGGNDQLVRQVFESALTAVVAPKMGVYTDERHSPRMNSDLSSWRLVEHS